MAYVKSRAKANSIKFIKILFITGIIFGISGLIFTIGLFLLFNS